MREQDFTARFCAIVERQGVYSPTLTAIGKLPFKPVVGDRLVWNLPNGHEVGGVVESAAWNVGKGHFCVYIFNTFSRIWPGGDLDDEVAEFKAAGFCLEPETPGLIPELRD